MAGEERKAADAFRTISEVADLLDVPQHVLRFWETKFTLLRPLKRGGGRRYYRPEDIDLLRRIRQLLHNDGYTIKGVQKLMREAGARAAFIARTAAAPAVAPAVHDTGTIVAGPMAAGRPPGATPVADPDAAGRFGPKPSAVAAALEHLQAARSLLLPFVRER